MLHAIGIDIYDVEHTITQQTTTDLKSTTGIGTELLVKAGIDAECTDSHQETIKTTYPTIDFSIDMDFISSLKSKSHGAFI